jgi:hypothetical protein
VNISFQKDWLFVCWLFFATFVLANGTQQRTFPTTVFTQQLEEKKTKTRMWQIVRLCWQKKQKTTTKAISSIFRSSTVSDVHVCA